MLAIRIAGTLVALAMAIVAGVGLGWFRFDRRIAREIDGLASDARGGQTTIVTDRDLAGLPEPVRRWLRYSKVVGTPRPSTARLKQKGQFQLAGRGWLPFAADQYFTTDPPGFLWKAWFSMNPLLWIAGRDLYRHGEGSIEMRLLSLVPVARSQGDGLNQGALLRYLGETQWFPAGALADYITWEAIDADSARATMKYGGVTASMAFLFASDGRVTGSIASRYNDARGRNESWINRNDADEELAGLRIPTSGEARWEYEDSGPFPYIRWQITELQLDRPGRY